MNISENTVVTIEYSLSDGEGNLLEQSTADENFAYLHGHGQLLEPLEEALEGKEVGDRVQINIDPENGFGQRNEELVITVPRDRFPEDEDITEGMQVEAETEQGHQIFTILGVKDEGVTLDGNHPYAGFPLDFDVTVKDIRTATEEELEHGHAHQEGHHHH
jgi:FKBP-type peptidyl-prolyl cis-trans isomerase SlyD